MIDIKSELCTHGWAGQRSKHSFFISGAFREAKNKIWRLFFSAKNVKIIL